MLEVIATKINYKEIYNLVKNLPTGKNVLTKPRGDFFYDPHILNEEYKGYRNRKTFRPYTYAWRGKSNCNGAGSKLFCPC